VGRSRQRTTNIDCVYSINLQAGYLKGWVESYKKTINSYHLALSQLLQSYNLILLDLF